MTPTPDELAHTRQWASALRGEGDCDMPLPLGFILGGEPAPAVLARCQCQVCSNPGLGDFTLQTTTCTDPHTGLVLSVEAQVHHDFPAVEWVVHIHNIATAASPILQRILPLDVTIPLRPAEPCTLHYALGALCSVDDFAPRQRHFTVGSELHLRPGWGRSSSEILPFMSLQTGGRGMVLAVGWTGEWAVDMSRGDDGTLRVQCGMAHTHLRLEPGESIRTPRILILCWEGEPIRGNNLLRRFILAYHRPRVRGEPLRGPLCCGNWGGTPAEVHLDNLERIAQHRLPFDYYWIDAEWFGKPGHWMENAGHWEPRPDLYPQGLEPIGQMAERNGMPLLLWFEPERVAPGTPWAREHADWLLQVPPGEAVTWADYGFHLATADWIRMESRRNQLNPGDRLFNLGHPQARRFLTDFLSDKITRFRLGCLRWDSNIAQLAYWRAADAPDRQGITEIRYVEGQYALWDELLERHPGLIIDNCASGGRRIDLESISRTVPLWRTDWPGDTIGVQGHSWGLMLWLPLHGTTAGYLHTATAYELRSRMCSCLVAGLWGSADARQERIPDEYPFDHARALLEEYRSVRDFFLGDYYPLTEYTLARDTWMAYQLDRPEHGDGLVVVLKRPLSPYCHASFRLQALVPHIEYELTDLDTGNVRVLTGSVLASEGLPVSLAGRPDSALIRYTARRTASGAA